MDDVEPADPRTLGRYGEDGLDLGVDRVPAGDERVHVVVAGKAGAVQRREPLPEGQVVGAGVRVFAHPVNVATASSGLRRFAASPRRSGLERLDAGRGGADGRL